MTSLTSHRIFQLRPMSPLHCVVVVGQSIEAAFLVIHWAMSHLSSQLAMMGAAMQVQPGLGHLVEVDIIRSLHEATVDRGSPVHSPGTLVLSISANESAAALNAPGSA